MAARTRDRDEDGDDLDDPPIQKKGNRLLLTGLAVGGAVVLLLSCTCVVGVIGVVTFSRAHPAEFVGSWKGRFVLGGEPQDIVYTFDKWGGLREDAFDLQGRHVHTTGGRWEFRDGQIEIEFDGGSFEVADAVFVDPNTINYRIVNHSEPAQIGLGTTFRRQ